MFFFPRPAVFLHKINVNHQFYQNSLLKSTVSHLEKNSIKYVNNNVILKSNYQNRTGNLSTFENCLAMFSSQIIKNNLIKSNILLSYKLLLVLQFAKNYDTCTINSKLTTSLINTRNKYYQGSLVLHSKDCNVNKEFYLVN